MGCVVNLIDGDSWVLGTSTEQRERRSKAGAIENKRMRSEIMKGKVIMNKRKKRALHNRRRTSVGLEVF
jgi:hypothetical protein